MIPSIKRWAAYLRKRAMDLALTMQQLLCEEILVIGDSHASVFGTLRLRLAFLRFFFNVVVVNGATVSGLENPNSKTMAKLIFMEHLARSRAKVVVVLLGEVDVGFVIWYRAEKYGTHVDEMLDVAVRNYEDLLKTIAQNHEVICVSAPLPTIRDGQHWGEVANARRQVKASQHDRTALTKSFNRHMEAYCRDNHLSYIGLDDESTGPDGLVASYLMNWDSTDHHFDSTAYARLITPRLQRLLQVRG